MVRTPHRAWLVAPAGLALLAGLDGALLRLGVLAPVTADRLADAHGPLLVLGFLGTLIALERAVALRRAWAYAAPGLLGAGAVACLLPVPLPVAATLFADGAAVLVGCYAALWRRQREDVVLVELLGAVAAACGAALWLRVDVPTLLPWLVVFVVLTIAAERVELARLHLPPGASRTLLLAAVTLVAAAGWSVLDPGSGTRVLGLVLLATVVWLAPHDVARRLLRSPGFPRFSASAMLLGYAWLALAASVWAVVGRPDRTPAYDTVVHATFLGFGMSMVLAHAPVILPAVLRRPLPDHRPLLLPLVLLHGGLLARLPLGYGLGLPAVHSFGAVVTVAALLSLPLAVVAALLTTAPPRPVPPRTPVHRP